MFWGCAFGGWYIVICCPFDPRFPVHNGLPPALTFLQRKIFQESAKAPVFPASIQLIFSAFDKNSSASFRHQTTSHDKHYGCWRFSVQSIDNGSFIHSRAFARESVCLYTRHAVRNSWKRRRGGKFCAAKQSLSICMYTYIQILHTLLYVCCNSSCRMVYKVVSMTQIPHLCSSCRSEIFLGYLMKQVVGWYI